MKKVFSAALLMVLLASNYSCQKADEVEVTPIRDFKAQTAFDMQNIEAYLKSHYIEVVNHPGFSDDMDVTITKIPTGGSQISIWNQTEYQLQNFDKYIIENETHDSILISINHSDFMFFDNEFACGQYIPKWSSNFKGIWNHHSSF